MSDSSHGNDNAKPAARNTVRRSHLVLRGRWFMAGLSVSTLLDWQRRRATLHSPRKAGKLRDSQHKRTQARPGS